MEVEFPTLMFYRYSPLFTDGTLHERVLNLLASNLHARFQQYNKFSIQFYNLKKISFIQFHSIEEMLIIQFHSMEKCLSYKFIVWKK